MAVSFPRLPRWLCGGNSNKPKGSSSSSSSSSSVNPSVKKTKSVSPTVKKTKRGWISKGEEEKLGNVVFPEPDDPEWSIGWVEPHGPGFKSCEDDDDDDCGGFVVLVPCYKKLLMNDGSLGKNQNQIPNGFFSPPDGKNMEQWLSSMGKL